jgi:HTH-type transcriptional regulator, sugar sensing transcriptional regulator
MNIEANLMQLGLSEKEAKTYLAALELGRPSISDISQKTGINRVTSYSIIDSLKSKGLISVTVKKKKKLYIPAEPDVLQRLVEAKAKIADQLMPHLFALSNISKTKPAIQFFEGETGMINLYQKTLDAKRELLTFGDEKHFYHLVLEKHFPDYRTQRKERAIKAKMIIPDTKQGRATQQSDREGFRETKLIPPGDYKFSVYFLLYNDSTIVISPGDLVGLYIESKDITQTLMSFHKLLWERL